MRWLSSNRAGGDEPYRVNSSERAPLLAESGPGAGGVDARDIHAATHVQERGRGQEARWGGTAPAGVSEKPEASLRYVPGGRSRPDLRGDERRELRETLDTSGHEGAAGERPTGRHEPCELRARFLREWESRELDSQRAIRDDRAERVRPGLGRRLAQFVLAALVLALPAEVIFGQPAGTGVRYALSWLTLNAFTASKNSHRSRFPRLF